MIDRTEQIFILDDGQKITASQLAKELRMSNPGARVRLKQSSDPRDVFRRIGQSINKNKPKQKGGVFAQSTVDNKQINTMRTTKEMKERMYFDPLGHWALINKCI
jgi:hypothetical protein